MKLPGLSRGRGTRRPFDPLGDPFEEAESEDTPGRRRAGNMAASAERGATRSTRRAPDDDDMGLGDLPPSDMSDSASGLVSRLFGSRPGSEDDLRGLSDLDGRPLNQGEGNRGALLGGLAALVVVGGLGWAWASGAFDGIMGGETETASNSHGAGPVSEVIAPDRVVAELPPLQVASEPEPDAVVDDPTAATDRSSDRRPWLSTGDAAEDETTAQPGTIATEMARANGESGSDAEGGPDQGPQDAATVADGASDPGDGADAPVDTAATADPTELGADAAASEDTAAGPPSMADADVPADTPRIPAEGVRARVDMAAPEIDLRNIPGLLPVPAGVAPFSEPDVPNRMAQTPPVPRYKDIPKAEGTRGSPLSDAPDDDLLEPGPYGPLPTVGPDGTPPWQAYAGRDRAADNQPRVAIVVHGLGMMEDPLEAAMTRLPPAVTLSFSPYARNLTEKMQAAREAGHEVMLDLPMEGAAFPAQDPGPLGMITLLPPHETLDRLQRLLPRGQGYVGVLAATPGKFANAPEPMEPVLSTLRKAGLLYLHQGGARALAANRRVLPPLRAVDVVIDQRGFAESIDARLDYLRRVAQARGSAIGVTGASPLAFARVRAWAESLAAQGIALAPVSALVTRGGGAGGGTALPDPEARSDLGSAERETPNAVATQDGAARHG
ncbi:divergent polysaccharide deacetylase family protein [uncultured Rhodospira sp.]|uniref:divergent polysaccharide deacetylase family protein n=1 Tax=uncultured Rhodospira sp. TaxID=1936189 RepID=UPI002632D632|nr:divergent polysaccharide deacetylase family protein [uncultured Rhodospira sp.]